MIPHLFEISDKGKYSPFYSKTCSWPDHSWVATELVSGVDVRLTLRSGECVRLEVEQRPNRDQRQQGVTEGWLRDAQQGFDTADYWVWEAVRASHIQGIPDGEWTGVAVGPKIKGNPYEMVKPKLILDSLVPWSKVLGSLAPIPSTVRCPVDYLELQDWFSNRGSELNRGVPVYGVTFWQYDEPVAQALRGMFDGKED